MLIDHNNTKSANNQEEQNCLNSPVQNLEQLSQLFAVVDQQIADGNYQEALSATERLLTITHDNKQLLIGDQSNYHEILLKKADLLNKLEQYQSAIELVDSIIARDPDNIVAWRSKGLALSQLNNYQQAIVCYDQALSLITKQQLAAALNLNSSSTATKTSLTISNDPTDSASTEEQRSDAQVTSISNNQQLDSAINWQALTHAVLLEKVACLRDSQRYQQAEEIIASILHRDPTCMLALNYQASLYLAQGKYHQALAVIEQVIEKLPNSSASYLNKMMAHYGLQDYQAAVLCGELAISERIIDHYNITDIAAILDYLAASHLQLTNYQDAIAYCDQLLALIAKSGIKISKSSADGYSTTSTFYYSAKECKALSLLMLGSEMVAAEQLIDEVLSWQPNRLSSLLVKGELVNSQGNYRPALEIAEQLLEIDAESPGAYYLKAQSLLYLGMQQEAIDYFSQSFALVELPLSPLQLSRRQAAIKMLEQDGVLFM